MKTIVVQTKKVVSHNADQTPVYEIIDQKIGPELTFSKFLKYLPNQGYVSAKILRVLKTEPVKPKDKDGRITYTTKEIGGIEEYQAMVDKALKPVKSNQKVDYKAELEKEHADKADLLKRLEALEKKNEGSGKSESRELLEEKANELNIKFDARLGDGKLLAKIQEVDAEFTLE